MLEFDEGGKTLWVHAPNGATVLRVTTRGGKIRVSKSCQNIVSHADVITTDDIEICMPKSKRVKG